MVKVRIEGAIEEVKKAVNQLKKAYVVLQCSEPYKNRRESEYVRVYADCELKKN